MIDLNNWFHELQDLLEEEETTMENRWKCIKQTLTLMCRESLCSKEHHGKEWISMETVFCIQERKNMNIVINNSRTTATTEKFKSQTEYTESNKRVKKSIRTDKQKYMEHIAMTELKSEREGYLKQL
ncbi:unnamed protein product [Schistosoma curassoni]|uniref:Uncharacterized protein n=1 Tax=Schistosoma curassoni TaxID=6186 RepID=A0A183JVI2_9TREM|nr:unnamed protein product [Schistosoma curassoni]